MSGHGVPTDLGMMIDDHWQSVLLPGSQPALGAARSFLSVTRGVAGDRESGRNKG